MHIYIYIPTVYIRLSWLGAIWPSNPMLQSSFKTPPAGSAIELSAIAANVIESTQCPSRGAYVKYLKEMRHIMFREMQRWWYGRKFRWCWCHVIVLIMYIMECADPKGQRMTYTHNSEVQRDSNRLDHSAKHKRRQTEDCASPTSIILLMLAMQPIVFKKSRTIEMYELKKKHSIYKYIVMTHNQGTISGPQFFQTMVFQPSVLLSCQCGLPFFREAQGTARSAKSRSSLAGGTGSSCGTGLATTTTSCTLQILEKGWERGWCNCKYIWKIHFICTVHFVCTEHIQYDDMIHLLFWAWHQHLYEYCIRCVYIDI